MRVFRLMVILFMVVGIVFVTLEINPKSTPTETSDLSIKEWAVKWISPGEPKDRPPLSIGSWEAGNPDHTLTSLPDGAAGAWIHIVIPPTKQWHHPGLLIDRLYGLNITVYENAIPVYQSSRNYDFERNVLLIPITAQPVSADLYLRIESKERAGLNSAVRIGEFNQLSNQFVRKGLPDILLGSSIFFLGLMILICSGYLRMNQRGLSVSLSLFALATGTLIVTYSSMLYFYFGEYGGLLVFLFDTSMYVLFPSLFYLVIQIFEGKLPLITIFERWTSRYFAFCFAIMVLYKLIGNPLYIYYKLFTFWLLAPLILIQLLTVIILSFRHAFRRNRNSIILASGIVLLAVSGVADLVLFYLSNEQHLLYLWKLGIVALIASLVMILNRRISGDYLKLLSYSKELELYNHQLQRTEKMQIISELAASIAHEVRNPMQVTRGFLQLLFKKSGEETQRHISMAINELDRASAIITDFLTFAKPEMDIMLPLDLQQELNKIETIMSPMVMMDGGTLSVNVSEGIRILGNPSKFKQALINMIKNSTESLHEEGKIEIEAYTDEKMAVIRIADNGEGMEEKQIAKLGEPYFSTKTKGTGLGLMVTFRIIEAMKGTLEFRSIKGKGTEAIVRFPLADQD